jgi:hypothetical protein
VSDSNTPTIGAGGLSTEERLIALVLGVVATEGWSTIFANIGRIARAIDATEVETMEAFARVLSLAKQGELYLDEIERRGGWDAPQAPEH